MKTIKIFVYALIVCMSFVGVAEAKGRTGSFKSGFTSQKRAAPTPAPAPYQAPPKTTQPNKTAFGSFGNANPKLDAKAAAAPQSQMSKDLSANAAQSNALKTADARTTTKNANEKTNASESESGWFRSGNQNTATQNPSVNMGNSAKPQPANYQAAPQYSAGRQSTGLMPGLIGFMLGSSMAQHANAGSVAQQNQSVPNQHVAQDANQLNSTAADGLIAQQAQDVPVVVEKESFFLKLLRVVLWAAIIGGIIWLVRKFLGFRNRTSQESANYSLRS
jgi:hypothetical protein